jgi:iron-sulfur cluster assembly accessory protein
MKTIEQFVTKDMIISDVLNKYPDVAVVMLEHGLHCVGCHANVFDTIEAGCAVHGLDASAVDKLVDEINAYIAEDNKKKQQVKEGPMKIFVTDVAAQKIKELLNKENKDGYALRVAVSPGGCSGFMYQMNFEKESVESDVVLTENGVKILVDKDSVDMLRGAEIDYIDNLNDSGFKVNNPNAKHGCGCGKSFG